MEISEAVEVVKKEWGLREVPPLDTVERHNFSKRVFEVVTQEKQEVSEPWEF